jgi:fermentation-respiration switch protein FrsA (DUF1100 family)
MSARLGLFAAAPIAAVVALVVSPDVWIDRLVFVPDRSSAPPPAGVEERWIAADGGIRLHAFHADAGTASPTLVWSHGNAGNIALRADLLLALRERGLSVLAYDYRGYGRSEGRPSEAGVYRDALAAYESVRGGGVAPERIVCFGESLGGAVSIRLASERACAGVAVVSTFTSLRDVARSHFGPLAALAGGRFDSLERIASLRVPLFAAHGARDEIVPFALGEQLYAAAPGPKRFLRIDWAHHNDIFASGELLDEIAAFAHSVTRQSSAE